MGRNISEFKGKYAVLGCDHDSEETLCKYHKDREQFYTIDKGWDVNPDLDLDITTTMPSDLNNRFELTILERMPFSAYNRQYVFNGFQKGDIGFANALAMTKEDGLIVIIGSAREKEFRECVKNLKYVECATDENQVILIPKNQTRTIEDIRRQCESLEAIKTIITTPIDTLNFCTLPFDKLSTYGINKVTECTRSRLFPAIKKMCEFGRKLESTDVNKAKIAVKLADDLLKLVDNFSKIDTPIPDETSLFITKFTELLHSKDDVMKEYIAIWKPIITNIAIALSGVGLFFIAGKLIHSKITTGHFYFFNEITHRQHLAEQIDHQFSKWNTDVTLAMSFRNTGWD